MQNKTREIDGKLIPYIRRNGVSVTDLANELRVDRATIYKWNAGRSYPTIDYVIKMSFYLKKDLRVIASLFYE